MSDDEENYGLLPRFERQVAFLACADLTFYGAAGAELNPKLIRDESARLAIEATKAIAGELGRGPGSVVMAMQRLARWHYDGRVTREQLHAVDDMLEAAASLHLDPRAVLNELRPVLVQRIEAEGTRGAVAALSKGGSLAVMEAAVARAQVLGRTHHVAATRLGVASLAEIEQARSLDRFVFDIPELDMILAGGPPRGTLTVIMGDPKAGKSIFCAHSLAAALRRRQFGSYLSLEVPRGMVLARLDASLTGISSNTILTTPQAPHVVNALAALEPVLGPCWVANMPARQTTVADVRRWVKDIEDMEKRPLDVLLLDYPDKLRLPKMQGQRPGRSSLYDEMGEVYEELRVWAEQKGFWIIAPTQSKGRNDQKGRKNEDTTESQVLDVGDVSDSIEKARIPDLFMSLNPRNRKTAAYFFLAASRYCKDRVGAGPVPMDLDTCRYPATAEGTPAAGMAELDW